MDILIRMLMAVLKDRKHKKQRRVLSTVLAAVVVFMTTYSLILPAITLEESTAETTDGIFLESADVSEADPADDDVDPSGELLLTDDAREESAPASDGWEDGLIEDADWEENGELADIPDEPALTDTGDETEEAAETETGNVYAETEEATEDTTESEESVGEGETESELEEQYPEVELSDSTQYTQVKVYAPEGAFPEGTQMLLSDVEDDETIAAICDAALAENSLVQKVHAVDISFRNSRNEEIEPLLPIRVEMTAEKCAEVGSSSVSSSVVHVDDSGNATIVENAQKVEAEAEDEKDADKLEDVETIAFEAKEFSVYALVYTVDFEYEYNGEMYRFSLSGGEKIKLSELVEVLGILSGTKYESTQSFLADVEDVEFSDETLVKVSKQEKVLGVFGSEDWVLESLQPFNTEETLTITMGDGEKIVVKVTDAQESTNLNNMLTGVTLTLNGEEVTNNSSVGAKDGDTFSLSLTFTENDTWQFVDDGSTMVYQLPEGVTLGNSSFSGNFVLDMGLDGVLSGNTYTYDPATRQLRVTWNTSASNFEALTDTANASFKITVNGQFDFTQNHIKFMDDFQFDLTHEDPHDASINKSGQYYPATSAENPYSYPAIKYTVVVDSEGSTNNLNIVDTVSGSALTLISGSASVVSNKSNNTIGTPSISNKSLSLHIGEMQNGEKVTITYWARVNLDEIAQSGHATVTETGNTVRVTHDDGEDEDTNVVHEINYSDFSKAAINVSDSIYDEATGKTYQRITWEIVTNSEYGKSLAGSTITDKIAESSKDKMSYSGQGITVKVYDSSNNLVAERTPSWSQVGVSNTTGDNKDMTWTYNVPSSDGNYKYVITYTTDYDITGMTGKTNATNYSEGQGGTDVGTAQVGPGEQDQLSVLKKAVEVDDEKITWNITINIPANTEYNDFWVTDTFPNIEYNSVGYLDTFDSVTVTGLTGGETWNWEYTYPSNPRDASVYGDKVNLPSGIKVNFTKDGANPGINKSSTNRTITVKVTTKNDPDWMNLAKTDSNSWVARHENNANVMGKGSSDIAYPMSKQVFKTRNGNNDSGKEDATVTINGVTYPLYRFQISLAGVYETPITVTDTFDTNLFEFYSDPSDDNRQTQFYGGSERSYPHTTQGEITATPTATGVTFTADTIPMNGDVPYGYYGIWYWVKPKNEAALEAMRQAAMATDDGKAIYHNKAEFGDSEDSAEFEYDYKIVDKQGVLNQTDGIVNYTIELNKDKLRLNNGQNMTMTDTYSSNLSVDFGSVAVEVDPAANKDIVTWDFRRNTGTFVIPDETYVKITYKARVVGENGATEHYENTAYMNGYYDSDTGNQTITSSGEGSATNYRIRLFKFGAGHMESGLNDVVFRLLDENKQPVISPKTGQPVTFTTGTVYMNNKGVVVTNAADIARYEAMTTEQLKAEGITKRDGFVQVMLSQSRDGIALKKETVYYLQEVQAPEGYETDYVQYSFAISDNPDYTPQGVDGVYVYHNNDVMTVRNWPESTSLRIVKQFAGNAFSQLTDEDKANVTFTITKLNEDTNEYEPFNVTVYRNGEEVSTNIVTYADKKDAKGTDLFQSGVMTIDLDSTQAGTYRVIESNYIVDRDGIVTRNTYVVDGNNTTNNQNPGQVTIESSDFDENNPKGHTVEITNTYFTGYYDFTKIDSNAGSLLGGATFGVFKASNDTQVGDDIVTDVESDAKFTVKKGDGRTYDNDTLYYVKEKEAPEGYELPDPTPKYYFFFSSDKDNPWTPTGLPEGATAVDLTTDFASEIVENGTPVDEDELSVVKEWKNSSGGTIPAGASSVEVTLKRYTMVNATKSVSVTVNGGNSSTASVSKNVEGGPITISWDDTWSGNVNSISVNGEAYDVSNVGKPDWDKRTLTISNVDSDLIISINQSGQVSSVSITGGTGNSSSTGSKVESQDTVFNNENHVYTLSAGNNWSHEWTISNDERATPKVEGDIILPKTDSKGNEYYYYVVETPVSDYETSYSPSSGGVKTGELKVINTGEGPSVGALKITKNVTINGNTPSGTTGNLADGAYTFAIAGPSPSTTVIKYVQVTISNGAAVSYKVAESNTEDAWDSANSVDGTEAIVTDLAEGDYTISEIAPTSPMKLIGASRGDGAASAVSVNNAVTVHVTAGDATAANTDAHATFVNDYTRVEVTKIWKDDSSGNEAWPSDTEVPSITLKLWKEVGSGSALGYLTLTVPRPTGTDPVAVAITPATEGITATVQQKTDTASEGYIVKVDGLPSKDGENLIVYTFTEEPVDNYNTTYSLLNGNTPASTEDVKESAGNREAIVNVPVTAVTLPSTGGPGTTLIYLLGTILIASAGALILLRRRRLINPPRRGGDPRI